MLCVALFYEPRPGANQFCREEYMSTIEKSVEVNAPVSTVYNQWTQFESFPRFMEGVTHVRQLNDKRLHWRAEIGGVDREWDSEIVQQLPDQQIAWRSVSGPRNSGVVAFQPLGSDRTRITLRMEYDPEGLVENVGNFLGVAERRVQGDLERFKKFIEARGQETGQWRGEIHGGEVHRPQETSRTSSETPQQSGGPSIGQRHQPQNTPASAPAYGSARLWSHNPLALVHQLSNEMDRLFDSFFQRDFAPASIGARSAARGAWTPQIDIRQQNGNLIVLADLPGMNREDVNIEIGDGVLTIQGERHEEKKSEQEGFRRLERTYGSFYRAIPLPDGVDVEHAEAHMENGVLEIVLPTPTLKETHGRRLEIH
jgi:HSP20 family molecular chaperone IbpA/uncharacterized membrane protein